MLRRAIPKVATLLAQIAHVISGLTILRIARDESLGAPRVVRVWYGAVK